MARYPLGWEKYPALTEWRARLFALIQQIFRMPRVPFFKLWILFLMLFFYQGAVTHDTGFCEESGAQPKDAPVVTPGQSGGRLFRHLARIVPPGWKQRKPAKRFTPENLWDKIDGRAEFFLSYDMVGMTFAEYSDASNARNYLSVSIYDMGKPANAFGVFAGERREGVTPVELGREAYGSGPNLFIWKGPYYVRMITSKDSPGLREINFQIAERLMGFLDDSGEPLRGLEILPKADRVPWSEQYFRRDAMGLDFMKDTYMARYLKKGVPVTIFLSMNKNPAEVGDILGHYVAYAKNFGEGTREIKRHGVVVTLCDLGGSYDALFQKGDLVAGVTSIEDRDFAVDAAFDLWQQLPVKFITNPK